MTEPTRILLIPTDCTAGSVELQQAQRHVQRALGEEVRAVLVPGMTGPPWFPIVDAGRLVADAVNELERKFDLERAESGRTGAFDGHVLSECDICSPETPAEHGEPVEVRLKVFDPVEGHKPGECDICDELR